MSEELLKQLLDEIRSLKKEVEELKAEREETPVYHSIRSKDQIPTPKIKSKEEELSSPEMQKAVDAVIEIYTTLKKLGKVR